MAQAFDNVSCHHISISCIRKFDSQLFHGGLAPRTHLKQLKLESIRELQPLVLNQSLNAP